MTCLVSIITVTYNDQWALSKTLKSIFSQSFTDFELIVVDGLSTDNTSSLVNFWQEYGLISEYIREKDNGVYDAMNKGVNASNGEYVVFMNSGDIFYSNNTLQKACTILKKTQVDALLGWGELSGLIWSSWLATPAINMSSLGFCHQSLYVKRKLCLKFPFDSRKFKTDSDTLQFSEICKNSEVFIYPHVLAIRSNDTGISANLDLTSKSIVDTIVTNYEGIDRKNALHILNFRRSCKNYKDVLKILETSNKQVIISLAILILDTIYLKQSRELSKTQIDNILSKAVTALLSYDIKYAKHVFSRITQAQHIKTEAMKEKIQYKNELIKKIISLENEINNKYKRNMRSYSKLKKSNKYIITLTSFPKRISSIHLVIESLLNQTIKPSKIYLNIGADEIKDRSWLPNKLTVLEQKGLIINFVKRTKHQYDKFLHICSDSAHLPIVMVDDDVIYPPRSMEYLLKKHYKYPELVVSNRPHKILLNNNGSISNYKLWTKEVHEVDPCFSIFPTGAGGVLYPVKFFDELVCDEKAILRCAPYADDIWLKGCSIVKNIKAICSDMLTNERWYYQYTPVMEEDALHKINVDKNLNDKQIIMTMEHFGIELSKIFKGIE